MKQLTIFDELDEVITSKFKAYHNKHREVYELFKKLTFDAKKNGHKHFSARGIFQVMRYKIGGNIKEDGFKYNNNYTPYYVRLFEHEHPEIIGFFEKRKVKNKPLILK